MSDIDDLDNAPADKYRIWDNHNKSFTRDKIYDSLSSASRRVDNLDNKYGGYRYSVKTITPSSSGGMGGAGGFEDPMKKGITNKMPSMKKGGKVSSASQRADGCCIRGKTRA
jgi:hypothetical protein